LPESRRAVSVPADLSQPGRSPCPSPRRRQSLRPARHDLLRGPCLRCAVPHRRDFLVVAGPAGRDDSQPPGTQEPLQLPVADWVMRGVYGFVIPAEELRPFLLGEVTENSFGSFGSSTSADSADMRPKLHPGPDADGSYAGPAGVAHAGQARKGYPDTTGAPMPGPRTAARRHAGIPGAPRDLAVRRRRFPSPAGSRPGPRRPGRAPP
jgi:hypothetical protein